jgi:hypothetical protein
MPQRRVQHVDDGLHDEFDDGLRAYPQANVVVDGVQR